MILKISPILLLPEELDPHLVGARRRITSSALVVVAVEVSYVSELLPLVEDFEALDEKSFPSSEVKLAHFLVWSFSGEQMWTHRLCHWPFEGVAESVSSLLLLRVLNLSPSGIDLPAFEALLQEESR